MAEENGMIMLMTQLVRQQQIFTELAGVRTLIAIHKMKVRRRRSRIRARYRQLLLLLSEAVAIRGTNVRRAWVHPKCGSWWSEIATQMPDDVWKDTFRISRSTLNIVCQRLHAGFHRQDTWYRKCIPLEKRIAMCIYSLTSSVELRTVSNLFGVGKSTLCTALHEFCSLVVENLMPEYIAFPKSEEELTLLMTDFMDEWQFPQAFGALDWCHIEVAPPKDHAADYYCYKGLYSTVLLALCDNASRFLYVSVAAPGRNNDTNVYARSSLSTLLPIGITYPSLTKDVSGVPVAPLILADSTFPLLPYIMTPFAEGPHYTGDQQRFNCQLSRARRVTENAFGRLKARFHILGKRLDFNLINVPPIVKVCCTLHNMCEVLGDVFDADWTVPDENVPVAAHRQVCTIGEEAGEAAIIRTALMTYFVHHET